MTSILNFSSSSTNTIPPLASNSLFTNSKLPTTFIIQPPSSVQTTSNTLLTKRYKAAELGDLLMKKIKTQTFSSGSQSPVIKENSEENDFNCLESTSVIEEINSPSTKSFCEDNETHNAHKMLEGVLIPHRSISTPLVVNTFSLRHTKSDPADNHKRVQHALEVLQKKILMDHQSSLLKEILFRTQASQEPLIIPPLLSASGSPSSPADNHRNAKKLAGFEDDEVIFGPVEYPLLAMAPPVFGGDFIQKDLIIPSVALSENVKKMKNGFFGSLAVTRAETQRSESDDMSSCSSEDSSEMIEVRKRQTKKVRNVKKAEKSGKGKKGDNKEKGQGKEKARNSKKQK